MFTIRRTLGPVVAMLAVISAPAFAEDTRSRDALLAELAERDALIEALRSELGELRALLGVVEPLAGASVPTSSERVPEPQARDPMPLVVDELAAERALERTLVQSGALLLPRGGLELVPALANGVSKIDFPVEVNGGTGIGLGAIELERTESVLGLTARIGLPLDSQLEIGLPYRIVTEESLLTVPGAPSTESKLTGRGRGDFALSFAKTLLRESGGARPDIIGRLTWTSGEGVGSDNGVALGGGFESWAGSLSFVKRLDPLALYWSLGYADTRGAGGIAPGQEVSASFGTALAVTPHSSLFGSIGHRAISATKLDGQALTGSDLDVTTLSLGLSTTLRRGALLNLYSEIGLSSDAPDYSLAFALPMRLR